ncbi:MAG: tRNA guanosine(15) transglycosylase TgtA [Thermoprotei archaeon]|nr:MAG: tRNA guanosine(15) transglycosylase TgtA [Thermoprotei archaeon]
MEYYDPRDFDLAGRIAKLKTRHGVIETPYLFPVVDPVKQVPSLNTLLDIGFNAFITNAYLLYRRNRGMVKNIHSYFSWNNPIMTDSGGYQILVYGSIEVDNVTIVKYEKMIDVDIGVILDIPTGSQMSRNEAWKAVKETYRRAWEALPVIMDSSQLWVYPIQGAPYRDLVMYSAIQSKRMPYHIYAFGSPTVYLEKYAYDELLELAIMAKLNLPPEKPFHVFGVGHPMIIPFLVAIGADLFDSASYILYARDERLMFEGGTKKLGELSYLPCNCPVCTRYTPQELREMSKTERIEAIAKHNLYILIREIKNVKEAIKEGRLWEHLVYRSRMHPSLRRAFTVLNKYRHLLEKYNPNTKTPTHAVLLLDADSASNPRLVATRRRLYRVIEREFSGKRILLVPAVNKPFTQQSIYVDARKKYPNYKVLFYNPYLGLFSPKHINTYPFFQHEIGTYAYNECVVEEAAWFLIRIKPNEVLVISAGEKSFRVFAERLVKILKSKLPGKTPIRIIRA